MRESSQEPILKNNDMVSILLSSLDEEIFFGQLANIIKDIFKQDKIVLYKACQEGPGAIMMSINGELPSEKKIDWGDGMAGYVIRTKRPYYSNSLKRDPLFRPGLYEGEVQAELAIPILYENYVLGSIHLQSTWSNRHFSDLEVTRVQGLLTDLKRPLANMQMYLSAKGLNEILLKRIEEKEKEQQQSFKSPYFKILKNLGEVNIIGSSRNILNILDIIEKLSFSTSNVLISGASGTGKELLGRKIHLTGPKRNHPYILVNCSSLNESMESSMGGGERDWDSCLLRRIFSAAKGGTIFFSNIDELNINMQTKLLRILQEKEIFAQSHEDYTNDVRIISSSSKDLLKEVEEGKFLNGLFFRIFSIHLKLPSLHQREEDILLLCNYFLNKNLKDEDQKFLSASAIRSLMNYPWPGNIRELKNLMNSLKIMSNGPMIDESFLPEEFKRPSDKETKPESKASVEELGHITLESLERRHICLTLERLMGNKTQAAKALGITVKTLYNKLHSYGMV